MYAVAGCWTTVRTVCEQLDLDVDADIDADYGREKPEGICVRST
jgi:hypothetical protein